MKRLSSAERGTLGSEEKRNIELAMDEAGIEIRLETSLRNLGLPAPRPGMNLIEAFSLVCDGLEECERRLQKTDFKEGFINRVRGLVNGEGHKVLLIKEPYLLEQFTRFGKELFLETQCYVIKVDDFEDIKQLDEDMMRECGWVRAETKKIITL